jgi:hypothetical protein
LKDLFGASSIRHSKYLGNETLHLLMSIFRDIGEKDVYKLFNRLLEPKLRFKEIINDKDILVMSNKKSFAEIKEDIKHFNRSESKRKLRIT